MAFVFRTETQEQGMRNAELLQQIFGKNVIVESMRACDGCDKTIPDDSQEYVCKTCGKLFDLCEECQKDKYTDLCPKGWGCGDQIN